MASGRVPKTNKTLLICALLLFYFAVWLPIYVVFSNGKKRKIVQAQTEIHKTDRKENLEGIKEQTFIHLCRVIR